MLRRPFDFTAHQYFRYLPALRTAQLKSPCSCDHEREQWQLHTAPIAASPTALFVARVDQCQASVNSYSSTNMGTPKYNTPPGTTTPRLTHIRSHSSPRTQEQSTRTLQTTHSLTFSTTSDRIHGFGKADEAVFRGSVEAVPGTLMNISCPFHLLKPRTRARAPRRHTNTTQKTPATMPPQLKQIRRRRPPPPRRHGRQSIPRLRLPAARPSFCRSKRPEETPLALLPYAHFRLRLL